MVFSPPRLFLFLSVFLLVKSELHEDVGLFAVNTRSITLARLESRCHSLGFVDTRAQGWFYKK